MSSRNVREAIPIMYHPHDDYLNTTLPRATAMDIDGRNPMRPQLQTKDYR